MDESSPVRLLVGTVVVACKLESIRVELDAVREDQRRFNAKAPDAPAEPREVAPDPPRG